MGTYDVARMGAMQKAEQSAERIIGKRVFKSPEERTKYIEAIIKTLLPVYLIEGHSDCET